MNNGAYMKDWNAMAEDGAIKAGMYITILEWHKFKVTDFNTGKEVERQDQSYVGDTLKIKAVDLPFLIVERVDRPAPYSINLDLRKLEIKELSDEFVAAACSSS